MKNGRRKGIAFERDACQLLHFLFMAATTSGGGAMGNTPANELAVRRRTTTVAPMDDWTSAGDLQLSKVLSKQLRDYCGLLPCIECKDIDRADLSAVMVKPTKQVVKFWEQTHKQAVDAVWSQAVSNAAGKKNARDGFVTPVLVLKLPRIGIVILSRDNRMHTVFKRAASHVAELTVTFNEGEWPGKTDPYRYALAFPL